MNKLLLFITVFAVISCGSDGINPDEPNDSVDSLNVENTVQDSIDKQIISDYDMSTVDKKNSKEFKENLVKIEKQYGEQWSFCDCVIKNDSIDKAFKNPNIPDKEFDRLANRLDEIDAKCQAFRIQNPNLTPEERAKHEKKVKKCLKEAGIK